MIRVSVKCPMYSFICKIENGPDSTQVMVFIRFQPPSQTLLHPLEPGWVEDGVVFRAPGRTHLLPPLPSKQHLSPS